MKIATIALALGFALAIAGCKPAGPQAGTHATEIAWREGDVDDALAEAKESGKQVILYWGAVWCPPCNQMKSTLFRDPAFIAETQNFVPVYLDGDTKGAQQWGERFGISGYPTVIVLTPGGSEVTRIASANMADDLQELLEVAAKRTTPIETLLAKAKDDPASLTAEDWTILGGFDWFNDPKHFAEQSDAGSLLGKLAERAPDPAMKRRFGMLSLAVEADTDKGLTPAQQAKVDTLLTAILSDPAEVKSARQEVIYYAPDLVAALPKGEARERLAKALVAAGDAIFADDKLALAERVDAVNIDITLAKDAKGKVPADVLAKVRERAKWADVNAMDKMQRQSVMDDAAYLLKDAGDIEGGRKILLAELKKSDQPYYYMSSLSDFAEEQGKTAEAIDWARKAYDAAQGPATRVQWAVNWASTIMELTPKDKAAVEASSAAAIDELAKSPGSYFQRTRVKVSKWGDKLRAWAEKNDGAEVFARLRKEMDGVCAKEETEVETCRKWSQAA
jgi:protein disulfide-isomerase